MLDIFSKVVELLAPTQPSIKTIRHEKPEQFVRFFTPHKVTDTTALSDYSNQIIKSAITANKFYNYEQASVLLSTLIKHWLETIPTKSTIFVPVPLSPKRLHSRGYNQVARVLTHIQDPNIKVIPLIARTKDTVPQTELPREQRFSNVADAFTYIHHPNITADVRIVLLDDVITTGATIHSAKLVLQENLPKQTEIISLALAH
ncbi:MAG: hypothetical protein R3B53_03340 [Candidatus Paceibacterota bacterium]